VVAKAMFKKLKNILVNPKAVSWPSLDEELGEYKFLLKGNVLNAGSGIPAGDRDLSKYIEGNLYNQDIFEHELIQISSPLHEIPFPDAFFDTIICNAVIEHVENPKEVINELSRVVKKGGYLYLSVPFMQPEHLVPTDFQRYTIDGLKKLVIEAGFDVEKADGIHTVYHTIGWILEQWLTPKKEFKYKILRLISFPLFRYLSRHSTEYIHSVASAYRVWAKKV
jgi:SAM-dependent methyltransferase